jgi:Ca-activated chloride channel family protein
MRFAHPHLLWLLLVFLPALVAFFWWSWRKRQALAKQFIQARLLPGLISGVSPARQKLRMAAILLAVVCVILALARPQWGFTWEEVKQRGLDIVVAIDTSKSMLAEDIAPNRLARAKLAALDLMQQARSDRLGLVAFAGSAFLQCPLTIDDNAFRQSVEAVDVNIIPSGGTALAEAINIARTAFKEGDNHKVLVIFSDGEDNDEGALDAAQVAAQEGLRIFTVGVGTAEGELLRTKDAKGRTDYIRDDQGNVVKSRLNESLLQEIAFATEGRMYLRLAGAKTIDALYEQGLSPLPKSEGQEKLMKRYHERYHWPLAVAILLLLAETLLPEQKRVSKRAAGPLEASAPGGVWLLLVLALGARTAFGSPGTALREYQAGRFDAALKGYEQALQRRKDDPRLHLNAGTAAYRLGDFEKAARHFGEALPAQDLKLQEQAYYNLGNTLYRTGEKAGDPQKAQQAWEEALRRFDGAIKLNTNNSDARFNFEFVKQKLEELKQQQQQQQEPQKPPDPSEAAKKAKAAADEAVRRREYRQALEIMENQLQHDRTTSYYSDYIERLKEVNSVKDSAPR